MAVSEAQQLFVRMLELTSVNNLDGPRVASDLLANQHLWRSFVFTREGALAVLALRDLPDNCLNYDTLFILATPTRQVELQALVEKWQPDELDWIGLDEARRKLGGRRSIQGFEEDTARVLLRVWWD